MWERNASLGSSKRLTIPFIAQNECCQIPANERDDTDDEGKIGSISFGNLPTRAVAEVYRGTIESACSHKWYNSSRPSYQTGWCVPIQPLTQHYPFGLRGTFFEQGGGTWTIQTPFPDTARVTIGPTRGCAPMVQRRASLYKWKPCQARALPTIFAHNLDGSVWVKSFENLNEFERYEKVPIHNVSSLYPLMLCVPLCHYSITKASR